MSYVQMRGRSTFIFERFHARYVYLSARLKSEKMKARDNYMELGVWGFGMWYFEFVSSLGLRISNLIYK
jgi:hypothetical protein